MTSPWRLDDPIDEDGPPSPKSKPTPELVATEPVYRSLMLALHACSADKELPTIAAVAALGEVLSDLVTASGALWAAPDIVPLLHGLADGLEQRRERGPARELQLTLRQFFMNARRPATN